MQKVTDVVIIGGGVIGCAIAYNLRKADREVIVLDKSEIGTEASSAAAGLLAPLGSISGPGDFADLLLASWRLFPTLVPELEEISDVHLEYERTSSLRIVRNPKFTKNLLKRMQEWQPLGLEMHWLTGDEARQHEQLLTADTAAAIYAPEESQIRAAQVARAFAKAASRKGANLYSHTAVTGIQEQHSKVTGVFTSKGELIECNQLIIAAGAWAAECCEWLNISLPVTPQRGQILSLMQPETPLKHIIFGEATYLVPKNDQTIIVGATKEDAGFAKHTTAGGVAWLLESAIKLVPALEHCPIDRLWAGLRPKTPDQHPILGAAPNWENVILATGHGSVGIMLSAITGQTIAELISTHQQPALIKPFTLQRFMQPELTSVPD